jgi:alpha-galactosidase/6-phospho-beta-glucosidase family protein
MIEHQNSEVITKKKIHEAIKALKEQKPKEREDISDREAIRKMRRYIEKLTSDKYGYSYDEVSEMLKGLGINLSGSRIKYLIGELKKSSRRQQKTSSSDEKNRSSNPATETQPIVVNTASDQASSEPDKSTVNSAKGKRKSKEPVAQQQQAE